MPDPTVSVIIVNYNGAHYLPACLDALMIQTCPADLFEVIVSDNGSSDGSQDLIRQHYPWVRLLENNSNLGFAAGNNVAIKMARGRYMLLLNNDTAPTPTWLENMLGVAEADGQIGLVSGHLQLFYDQLELQLETETFNAPGDSRALGLMVYDVDSQAPRSVTQYLQGFYGREVLPDGQVFRWLQASGRLGVPVPLGEGEWALRLSLSSGRPGGLPDAQFVRLRVFLHGRLLAEWQIGAGAPQSYSLTMPAETRALAKPLEQNTGSVIFFSGAGRDRGTYVRDNEVFYETDEGQYSRTEEVFAGCGGSLLLRNTMLAEVGWFDGDLFMYYEDTDLSWRARLQGWKVVYAADARVRHIHCGTTKEWSPFFMVLTERNRLAMVFKNGSLRQVAHVWGGYLLKVVSLGWQTLFRLLLGRAGWRWHAGRMRIHLRVLATLAAWQPALWRKRRLIQRSARVSPGSLESWFLH